MQHFIISVQGRNRTGIVADVTRVLYEQGANIMDSSMTTLRNEFTMMLLVSLAKEADTLIFFQGLQALKDKELGLYIKPISSEEAARRPEDSQANYIISVLGVDRTGIVYQVSQLLTDEGINITDLNTQLVEGPDKSIYTMILEINLHDSVDPKELNTKLQAIAQELHVDLNVHPIDFAEI